MTAPDARSIQPENTKKPFVEPMLVEFDSLEKQIQGLRILESFTGSILAP